MYVCGKNCLILIPFWLPQLSCFTLCFKYFSSDSDNCPNVGIIPQFQFPHPPRAGTVLLTVLFSPLVPLSYWILHGSLCSFPVVRYSCLLSAGVLHALLCLQVCSWCISRERYIPRSPTPLPSCSPSKIGHPFMFSNSLDFQYELLSLYILCIFQLGFLDMCAFVCVCVCASWILILSQLYIIFNFHSWYDLFLQK